MQTRYLRTPSGLLSVRTTRGGTPPLLCLHGFTLHGGMFERLGRMSRRSIVAPDLPGHGDTRVTPVDLRATLVALEVLVETVSAEPVPVLGYSQGGRIALHLAVRRPDLVSQLVLVSTSPGMPPTEMRVRRDVDEAQATRIERDGMKSFLDGWSRHPLVGTSHLDPDAAAADRRLREENSAAGLAAALRGLGQGVVPGVDRSRLSMPLLWVTGERDTTYTAMASATGDAHEVIPGSGHNVVLEAPEALAILVAGTLGYAGPGPDTSSGVPTSNST